MKKLETKDIGKLTVNKKLVGIPNELKSVDKFNEIEAKIKRLSVSDHKHRLVGAWMKCKRCQVKFNKRREYIQKLGFKSNEQYQLYKKVMGYIISKENMVLYEK